MDTDKLFEQHEVKLKEGELILHDGHFYSCHNIGLSTLKHVLQRRPQLHQSGKIILIPKKYENQRAKHKSKDKKSDVSKSNGSSSGNLRGKNLSPK